MPFKLPINNRGTTKQTADSIVRLLPEDVLFLIFSQLELEDLMVCSTVRTLAEKANPI